MALVDVEKELCLASKPNFLVSLRKQCAVMTPN